MRACFGPVSSSGLSNQLSRRSRMRAFFCLTAAQPLLLLAVVATVVVAYANERDNRIAPTPPTNFRPRITLSVRTPITI